MSDIVPEGVSKRYGAVRAIDGLSLRAESGKLLVLLGSSGGGKSTNLRLMAGLENPNEGRILIGGRDVTRRVVDLSIDTATDASDHQPLRLTLRD